MFAQQIYGMAGVFLIIVLSACNNLSNQNSSSQVFERAIESNTKIEGLDSRAININGAFEKTLFPLLTQNCSSCHGFSGNNPPLFAHSFPETALTELTQANLVNFLSPDESKIVIKLISQQHYCWSNCADDAAVFSNAISEWRSLISSAGQVLYNNVCVNCHGIDGSGRNKLTNLTKPFSFPELVLVIENTMPPANPSDCVGVCATEIANYIVNHFSPNTVNVQKPDPLFGFSKGQAQISKLCDELAVLNRSDIVRNVFCNSPAPTITSLGDLQELIGLKFMTPADPTFNGQRPMFVLSGHSTSLVAKSTSAINPRAIIFSNFDQRSLGNIVAMGFNRGEQFVEIVTVDRNSRELFFYLLVFEQSCNVNNACTNGDLLTRAIELNWTDYTVYSQTDLKNTILDCLQCHQPDGPTTPSILRMQEINFPWTHFLTTGTEGGNALLDDYFSAHTSNDVYANIPANLISFTEPFELELFISEFSPVPISGGGGGVPGPQPPTTAPPPIASTPPATTRPIPPPSASPTPPVIASPPMDGWGLATQPNQFDSEIIEQEVRTSNIQQPFVNDPPGISQTWETIYEASVRGEFIPVPYHDVKVTDPIKLANMSQAYSDFMSGVLTAADLPDIRDVFLESQLPAIGFKVKPGLDGAGIVTQACTQCHNSKLDQTITRARFNVDLSMMSDTVGGVLMGVERDNELAVAISRLQLSDNDIRKMPPVIFKTLDQAEIDLAIQYLCSQSVSVISVCN